MKKKNLLLTLVIFLFVTFICSISIGSVSISPLNTANVLFYKLLGICPFGSIDPLEQSILLTIRIPRTLLALIAGSGFALSGVIMQSVLQNPLASSFTLGVSSGASLGASLAILLGTSFFSFLTLPIFGLTGGLFSVFFTLALASRMDRHLHNHSIILIGMAFSLFANSMVTIVMSLSREQLQRLISWQMGSFAMKPVAQLVLLIPFLLIGFLVPFSLSTQMDIMTLGDEQANISGIEVKRLKQLLLSISAILTGAVVSIVGVIGFVDLFTPHMARKLFGSSHKYIFPASALLGGIFMMLCDLIARILIAPLELPVGAITSAIGAPFFIYLYFRKSNSTP